MQAQRISTLKGSARAPLTPAAAAWDRGLQSRTLTCGAVLVPSRNDNMSVGQDSHVAQDPGVKGVLQKQGTGPEI